MIPVVQAASLSGQQSSDSLAARPTVDRPGEMVVHSPHYVTTTDLAKNQRPSSSIYDGKWKLVAWYETGDLHLFDLDADISESTDVSDKHPDVKHDLWVRLLPNIRDSSTTFQRTLFWEHETHSAIRQGDWKLVTLNGTDDAAWELYDLSDLRTETENVAAANPDRVDSMKATWRTWATQANVLPWPRDRK